jgi:hypothetical protein
MLCYEFKIICMKGKHNILGDPLSRKVEETKGSQCVNSITQSDGVEEVWI